MAYPFLNSGLSITGNTPQQDYVSLAQETLNAQFSDASNVYVIEEESYFSSGIYQNVTVRVSNMINPTTANNVEDDFKKITFKELNHSVDLGRYYRFNDNYWITTNVDKIKTLYQTAIVKRCNNTLRWYDSDGAYHSIPCSLEYLINENRDYSTAGSQIVVPSGMLQCIVQYNQEINKIKPNQRFLFGNQSAWSAWRVEGGGINNFNNTKTLSNTSVGFVRLSFAVDFVNVETDDLTSGIANKYDNQYVINLNQNSISGDNTQTVTLIPSLSLNGIDVSGTFTWASSDETVATVSSSGIVTFLAEGNAVITCSLLGNNSVYDTCSVVVTAGIPVDNYQVVYSPMSSKVYEGKSQTWSVYLYLNGVIQPNAFSFTLIPRTVPSSNYVFTIVDGNSFRIQNMEMFLGDNLEIILTSGLHEITIPVSLVGAW